MKTSEVLRAGYDRLLIEGWGQGSSYPKPCVGQALGWHDGALRYMRTAVGHPSRSVALWNDWPGRTFDEVCDALQTAIKLAEADEAKS